MAGMQQGGGQRGQLPPQILADQLTLSQPGGADYAHHSITCPPGCLTLAASLESIYCSKLSFCQNDPPMGKKLR